MFFVRLYLPCLLSECLNLENFIIDSFDMNTYKMYNDKVFFYSEVNKIPILSLVRFQTDRAAAASWQVLELYRLDPFTFFSCFATFMVEHLVAMSRER